MEILERTKYHKVCIKADFLFPRSDSGTLVLRKQDSLELPNRTGRSWTGRSQRTSPVEGRNE